MKKVVPIPTPDLNRAFSAKLIADAVKAKRTQMALSTKDAAQYACVSRSALINLEAGKENVPLSTVIKVMSALDIKVSIQSWDKEESDVWF